MILLREQLSQIFHSGGREGNRLLILGAMDPEATVLGAWRRAPDFEGQIPGRRGFKGWPLPGTPAR